MLIVSRERKILNKHVYVVMASCTMEKSGKCSITEGPGLLMTLGGRIREGFLREAIAKRGPE